MQHKTYEKFVLMRRSYIMFLTTSIYIQSEDIICRTIASQRVIMHEHDFYSGGYV